MDYTNSSTIFPRNSSTIFFQVQTHDVTYILFTLASSLLVPVLVFVKWFFPVGFGNNQVPPPPGPTPWPVIGNLYHIWKNKPSFKWILGVMEQLDTEIACIRLGKTHVIPVTSPEIAREFLKTHDSTFASRPLTMAAEYATRGFLATILVPSGDQWKKMRKVIACNILNPAKLMSGSLLHKRSQEADNLVSFVYKQCMNTSTNNDGCVINLRLVTRNYTGNVIRKMMFNKRYFGKGTPDGGPGREEKEHVDSLFTLLAHLYNFALSDYVPWLRPLDLDGHEKIVRHAVKVINGYHDPIIDDRVKQWKQQLAEEEEEKEQDLLDAFILAKDSKGNPALSVEEIKAQCLEIMIATVDNPSNAVEWALAEMLNKPHILHKARQEIDQVVGKGRWVQETDLPQLNYVKACAREALRLHPIAPFNVPHVSNADAVVAGHFIPKGSHVLLSRVGLGRNGRVWDQPMEFRPERHLNKSGSRVDLTETELRFISFSTGRRGCMGVALGTEMTIMLLARLIQGFDWTPPSPNAIIDLSEATHDLFLAKPLHALAKPRLSASLYF